MVKDTIHLFLHVKSSFLLLVVVGTLLVVSVTGQCSNPATFDTTQAYYIVARHSDKALRVSSPTLGSRIEQQTWEFVELERWRFEAVPGSSNNEYYIFNEVTNLVLSVDPIAGGTYVTQVAPSNPIQESWCFDPDGEGFYNILIQDLSMDIGGASIADGAQVLLWFDWSATNQDFEIIPVGGVTPEPTASPTQSTEPSITNISSPPSQDTPCEQFDTSIMYNFIARHSLKALHPESVSEPEANTVQLTPDPFVAGANWQLQPAGDKYYNIINADSGLCLSVLSDVPGEPVRQRNHRAAEDSKFKWCFMADGEGYYNIVNQFSGYTLDVAAASQAEGGRVDQWYISSAGNQDFSVVQSTVDSSMYPGEWSDVIPAPLVPVAAGNIFDGRVVVWSAYARYDFVGSIGQTWTAIFDPDTETFSEALVQNTNHDMFCPGTTVLADTRIVITGGSTAESTTIFDPRVGPQGSWTAGPDMNIPRGYHSMTMLTNGDVLTIGGSWSGAIGGKVGEVWDYDTETWTTKPDIIDTPLNTQDAAGLYRSDNHMWLFTAPNGKVFHAGPSVNMHWIDTVGTGSVTASLVRGDDVDSMNGNAVMFDIGKILKIGGAEDYDGGPANANAFVIDINGGEGAVTVERQGDMQARRTLCNSVVLPSGQVVVVGGMTETALFSDISALLLAEIWDPATGEFSLLKPMAIPRTYHSIGLLLRDGRVLVGGGGLCGGCGVNHDDVEILSPPYLLDGDGNPATRPQMSSVPANLVHGEIFTVEMDATGPYTFALMRLGVVTHAVNNDSRRIPLQGLLVNTLGNGNGVFELSIPANPSIALTGAYFLFAMDANGVPSIAHTVSILVPGATLVPTVGLSPAPSGLPTTTLLPSLAPSEVPTTANSPPPTGSTVPSETPTEIPTTVNSPPPTGSTVPSETPTEIPTIVNSPPPTGSTAPSETPTQVPTVFPSSTPSIAPSSADPGGPTNCRRPPRALGEVDLYDELASLRVVEVPISWRTEDGVAVLRSLMNTTQPNEYINANGHLEGKRVVSVPPNWSQNHQAMMYLEQLLSTDPYSLFPKNDSSK